MGRVLAIDYGLRRTGIAVTDPLKLIAAPLQTVPTAELMDFLQDYLGREEVECFVMGDPKDHHNRPFPLREKVLELKEKLEEHFPSKKVVLTDERFSSSMAQKVLIEAGHKRKVRSEKTNMDKISAAIILQSYLESTRK